MHLRLSRDGYIRPIHADDNVIFEHCAAGMIAVTPDHFKKVVGPLLRYHLEPLDPFLRFHFFNEQGKGIEI